MTIEEKILSTFQGKEGKQFRRREIIDLVLKKYPGTNATSVIPSDYCYNMRNEGSNPDFRVFQFISRGQYKYLGLDYNYTGPEFWKGELFGEWKNGKYKKL